MSSRRSLKLPITLAIVMIVLLIVLTVGWIILTVAGAVSQTDSAPLYWTVLAIGTVLLVVVLVGVVVYLTLSIKAINLTRRQSNFIDSVTHELKSPIASLKLYLQTLGMRRVTEDELDNFCRFMLEDVERLDHLINHVLDAGQIEKGVAEGEEEDVYLADLLQSCAQTVCLSYRVPAQTVHIEAEPCVVRSRRADLEMIFRNLIDNAVKYSGELPEVWVSTRYDGERKTITTIQDNGPGVPPKMRRRMFGRFERLGVELERKKPGTGLGLYIVRTLVRRLRGRVRVRDVQDTTGAIFEVELPGRLATSDERISQPDQSVEVQ